MLNNGIERCAASLKYLLADTAKVLPNMQETLLEAIRGVSQDQLFNVCGTVGGLLLAGAQIPQIYHVTARQRARDVSFAYQVRQAAASTVAAASVATMFRRFW